MNNGILLIFAALALLELEAFMVVLAVTVIIILLLLCPGLEILVKVPEPVDFHR
jgi:hypothetical protein